MTYLTIFHYSYNTNTLIPNIRNSNHYILLSLCYHINENITFIIENLILFPYLLVLIYNMMYLMIFNYSHNTNTLIPNIRNSNHCNLLSICCHINKNLTFIIINMKFFPYLLLFIYNMRLSTILDYAHNTTTLIANLWNRYHCIPANSVCNRNFFFFFLRWRVYYCTRYKE